MTTPLRLSPIHAPLQSLQGTWQEVNGMPILATLPQTVQQIGIADLSCLTRFGVKGGGAASWLADQGLPVPERPNSWLPLPSGLIARLGVTEFLIESPIAPQLAAACQTPPHRVYPVLRQDLALGLVGDRAPDLLRQTCSFNFQSLELSDRPVVLTSMIGVGVTVLPTDHQGQPYYRIWCDGTFGVYVWETLVAIAQELGGGPLGTAALLNHPI